MCGGGGRGLEKLRKENENHLACYPEITTINILALGSVCVSDILIHFPLNLYIEV